MNLNLDIVCNKRTKENGGTHLRRLYVLILIDDGYIIERLPEPNVLVLIVELLLVVVRRAEPFPR